MGRPQRRNVPPPQRYRQAGDLVSWRPVGGASEPTKKIAKQAPKARLKSTSGTPVLKEKNCLLWFQYICERQRVFGKWLEGAAHPWTQDSTLANGAQAQELRFTPVACSAPLSAAAAGGRAAVQQLPLPRPRDDLGHRPRG